jgi:hypothetical protein
MCVKVSSDALEHIRAQSRSLLEGSAATRLAFWIRRRVGRLDAAGAGYIRGGRRAATARPSASALTAPDHRALRPRQDPGSVEEWARRRGLRGDLQAQTRHGSGEPNAPPIGAGYREAADDLGDLVRRLARRFKRCLMDPRGRKRAFPSPPAARRSALVVRPREIANMSCSRSRTDDGAAMPSAY